jgi:acyl carrier protein
MHKMAAGAVYEKLTEILQNVFDDEELVATADLTADDVLGWDSFANIRIMMAIEESFGINFSAAETLSARNVGDLASLIQTKSSQVPQG